MKRSVVLAILMLVALLPSAYSANITVIAEGVFSEYSDPDGLLPFSEPAPGTIFTMEFTYDDTTPDAFFDRDPDPLPVFGQYVDAISAAKLTIGTDTFEMGELGFINVIDDSPSDGNYVDLWHASTVTSTPTGIPDQFLNEGFALVLANSSSLFPAPPLTSDALVKPSWPSDWEIGQISYSIDRFIQSDSTSSERLAFANANITSITTTAVPLPAAGWLLGSALGLLGWVTRRNAYFE